MADTIQPAQAAAQAAAPAEEEESSSVTLQVVSPSVGVSSPLSFPNLPGSTTVKQLKAKIRDVLPSKPPDDGQRLIHRGRMLARETETLIEVFGQETLAGHEAQILHLVLRPEVPNASSPSPQPPTTSTPTSAPQLNPTGVPILPHLQPRVQSAPVNPLQAMQGMHAQQPFAGFQNPMQQHVAADSVQGAMAQRLAQLRRETQLLHQEMLLAEQRARGQAGQGIAPQVPFAPGIPPQSIFHRPVGPPAFSPGSLQHLINQQQRERAADGRQGAQDTGVPGQPGHFPPTASGRASPIAHRPDSTTTYTREGVGPNGERWSVTVNETTTTFPIPQQQPHHHHYHHPIPHANPAMEIQAVLRNADRLLAQNGQNNMQRSASNPNPYSTASGPAAASETSRTIATPATTNSSPSSSAILNPSANTNLALPPQATAMLSVPSTSTSAQPIVYLLSSPSGPRAVLINNSETYFTPLLPSRRHPPPPTQFPGQAPGGPAVLPEYRNRGAHPARAPRPAAPAAPAAPAPPAAPAVANAPHANPGAGALGARIGPLLWLVVRLVAFVWFFTSGNPSWSRWFMISALGLVVFLVNTGLFNGVANDAFGPIRRHLENLIPLAGPEAALVPAANAAIPQPARDPPAGGLTAQQRQRGQLDPAEVAARIMEERRQAQGGWLVAQIRRAEHSFLLFLASLVPGVGERHIAAREAEAAAAEVRRAEAIAAAEAAANAANTDAAEARGVGGAERTSEQRENDTNGAQNNDRAAPPAQPLIDP